MSKKNNTRTVSPLDSYDGEEYNDDNNDKYSENNKTERKFVLMYVSNGEMSIDEERVWVSKYGHLNFSIPYNMYDRWETLSESLYFWLSCLIMLSASGLGVTSFVNMFYQWVYPQIVWIFWMVHSAITLLFVVVYLYNQINQTWFDYSDNFKERINYAFFVMAIPVVFTASAVSTYISRSDVPGCCFNIVYGVMTTPINVELWVQWMIINSVCVFLCFAIVVADYINISSQIFPERKHSVLEGMQSIQKMPLREDRQDLLTQVNQNLQRIKNGNIGKKNQKNQKNV